MFTRYAIYYTPDVGTALAEFGTDWLGWDSASGESRAHGEFGNGGIAEATKTPRKYGFHGTIKPPFRLAEGCTAEELAKALATLCAQSAPVVLEGMALARLGRFLALVPVGDVGSLAALAANAVQELDRFRAPATEAELAKRRKSRLSPAQDANLIAWGYPYVLDQFRFHMTLTGALDDTARANVHATLQKPLSNLDLTPYTMTGLTLLGEDSSGKFHQIQRFSLKGNA